jgi:predicted dehydrogenase
VTIAKIGFIGVGNIAPAYFKGCSGYDFAEVAACADMDMDRARAFANERGIRALSVDELLADDEIDIVINLTIPIAHVDVNLKIIEAGKHCYSEKPFALTREDGQRILDAASAQGVRVGSAPDTFLGAGAQTCRKLIDSGAIGEPVAATLFMMSAGPERWHPNPFFFYEYGGGPVLDMAPYYIGNIVNLLGPIRRISASARRSFAERTAGHQKFNGKKFPSQVNSHVSGVLDFAKGPVGTIILSFDIQQHQLPRFEIYGSEGSISFADPNFFGGPVRVWDRQSEAWREHPLTHSDRMDRGFGCVEMAHAILNERPHRASGEFAYHILDVMLAFEEASERGQAVELASMVERPEPLPMTEGAIQF